MRLFKKRSSKFQWRILEFLQESNGRFSSSRLFMLLVALSAVVDWQHAVWMLESGIWNPEWTTIGMILGVLGFKIAQKPFEEKFVKEKVEIENVNIDVDELG